MTQINWQESSSPEQHKKLPSPAHNNPWIGATMLLIGIIVGFIIGKIDCDRDQKPMLKA